MEAGGGVVDLLLWEKVIGDWIRERIYMQEGCKGARFVLYHIGKQNPISDTNTNHKNNTQNILRGD